MYRVRLIFAQYTQSYPGQLQPNVVDAWDEYVLDENLDGFNDALRRHKAMVGTDYEWVRVLDVLIDQDSIDNLASIPSAVGVTD